MSGTAEPAWDIEREVAQVRRAQEETRKFVEEQHKLIAESKKLNAEALKFQRDRGLAPWQIVVTAMGTGAALFAAGAAFLKLLGA